MQRQIAPGHSVLHPVTRQILQHPSKVDTSKFSRGALIDACKRGVFVSMEPERPAPVAPALTVEGEDSDEPTDSVSVLGEKPKAEPAPDQPVVKVEDAEPAVDDKWGLDPESLKDKSLEDLVLLIIDRDFQGELPDTVEGAVALLTRTFKG